MKANTKYQKQLKRERALSPFLPYSSVISKDTVFTKEGDYLRIYRLSGIAFETKDPSEIFLRKEELSTLLRSIGSAHISLYVHHIRRQVSDKLFASFPNRFLTELDDKYARSLEGEQMMGNEIFLTVLYRPYPSKTEKVFAKPRGRTFSEITLEEEKNLSVFDEISSQIEGSLSRYEVCPLETYEEGGVLFSEMLEFLEFLLTGEFQRVRLPSIPLSDYLGTSSILVGSETLEIRGVDSTRYARVLDLKDYPKETEPGLLNCLLYEDFSYIQTQSFRFLPKYVGKAKLEKQQKQLSNAEDAASSQIAEISEALDQLISGEFLVGEYHYSLLVFGDSVDEVRKNTSNAAASLQDRGFLPTVQTLALDAAFFAQLPANFSYRTRPVHLTSKNFASLASFHNFPEGKRDGNPWGQAVTILKTPSKQPFYFNFHASSVLEDSFDKKVLGNTRVIGQSGAGKTVLLTFLLCQAQKYRKNAPLGYTDVFFDKDRGAELAVRALGGKYLALENGKPTGLNPFQLEPSETNLLFLESFVKLLVTRDGYTLSPREEENLSRAVRTVMGFENPKHRRISLLTQNITENKDGTLAQRLAKWREGGPLAWVFDNEADQLDFTTHANYGIDGTAFLDNADISSPISYYLLHRMESVIDGRRFLYIMDEFWKWLSDPAFKSFAFDKQKTIRKQNGLGVFATQSPQDVLSSDISRAIIEQCATEIYLPNPKADKAEYLEGFKLTEMEFEVLTSLGEDSRLFLVKQGHQSTVCQLNLSGFSDELTLLSGSIDNLELLHDLMRELGEEPSLWIPEFHRRRRARKASSRQT